MTVYETVRSSVTAREAAEFYGIRVSPRGMARCPFHPDRHPSLKLGTRFYCFGCQEKGDVIRFTAKLFGLSPYDAARKLIADFHIRNAPQAAVPQAAPVLRPDTCRHALEDYLDLLSSWKILYAPKSPEIPADERYIEACLWTDRIRYDLEVLDTGSPGERQAILDYFSDRKTGALLHRLKERRITD